MLDPKEFPYLPIDEGNHLVLVDSKREQRKGMDNDDDYYNEVASSGEIVAKYHTWHHMSIYPPQNVDSGWEKLDLSGNVISRGKK